TCSFHSSATPLYLHSFPTRRSSDLMLRECRIANPSEWACLFIVEGKFVVVFVPIATMRAYGQDLWTEDLMRKAAQTLIEIKRRRSEEHTSELQSRFDLVCRLLLEKK